MAKAYWVISAAFAAFMGIALTYPGFPVYLIVGVSITLLGLTYSAFQAGRVQNIAESRAIVTNSTFSAVFSIGAVIAGIALGIVGAPTWLTVVVAILLGFVLVLYTLFMKQT